MNPDKRRLIYERLRAANPSPRSELAFRTPYELLVAVVLSAQATDKSVNLATARLFPVADTPERMLALGVVGLEQHIRSIGLYRTKAKNVIALSRILVEEHGGRVPAERGALERLPGVGRKTANVVLNTAFGQRDWKRPIEQLIEQGWVMKRRVLPASSTHGKQIKLAALSANPIDLDTITLGKTAETKP